jgi:hypothetical protein
MLHQAVDVTRPRRIGLETAVAIPEQEIDIRGDAEFATAQLAERNHAGRGHTRLPGGAVDRCTQTALRQVRELCLALLERAPQQLARRNPEQSPVLVLRYGVPAPRRGCGVGWRWRITPEILNPRRVPDQAAAEKLARPQDQRHRGHRPEVEHLTQTFPASLCQLVQAPRSLPGSRRKQQRGNPRRAAGRQLGECGGALQRPGRRRRLALPELRQRLESRQLVSLQALQH